MASKSNGAVRPEPRKSKSLDVSSLFFSVVPQWSYLLSLIFIGCCSNAYYLELSTDQAPDLGTLLTVLQFFFTTLVALPSQLVRRGKDGKLSWKKNRVPMYRWGVQVALYASTTLLNNVAFAFDVPMPVHIIFRSGGLVVNMLMGWLIRSRRYSPLQILSVILVTAGVTLATLSTSPPSSPPIDQSSSTSGVGVSSYFIGISLLLLALVLSSLMGIWQEITFARYGRDNWQEAVFYGHLLSLPLLGMRAGSLKTEWATAKATPPTWIGLGQPKSIPAGGIWDLTMLFRLCLPSYLYNGLSGFFSTSKSSPPLGLTVPSVFPLLALNVLTQLACINGVNRLTSRVSSVTVTLVLVVRKAVSLAISVLLVGGGKRGDMRTLTIGAVMVAVGTLGYTWASSGNSGATKPATKETSKSSRSSQNAAKGISSTIRARPQHAEVRKRPIGQQ